MTAQLEVQIVRHEGGGYSVVIPCFSVAEALTIAANALEPVVASPKKNGKTSPSNVGVTAAIVEILTKHSEQTTEQIHSALASTPFKGYPSKNIAASLSSLEKSMRVRRDRSEKPHRWSLTFRREKPA